jgi:hypothetical protein
MATIVRRSEGCEHVPLHPPTTFHLRRPVGRRQIAGSRIAGTLARVQRTGRRRSTRSSGRRRTGGVSSSTRRTAPRSPASIRSCSAGQSPTRATTARRSHRPRTPGTISASRRRRSTFGRCGQPAKAIRRCRCTSTSPWTIWTRRSRTPSAWGPKWPRTSRRTRFASCLTRPDTPSACTSTPNRSGDTMRHAHRSRPGYSSSRLTPLSPVRPSACGWDDVCGSLDCTTRSLLPIGS